MTRIIKSGHRPAASTLGLALALAGAATGLGAATASATTTQRSPQSIECSRQADAKGLHGKDRKAFRSTCMRHATGGHATGGHGSQAMTAPTPLTAKKSY